MAPLGAPRQLLIPGLDPMALLILLLMLLPYIHGLPAKSEKLISETDKYYVNDDGTRCQLCPPGTFVKTSCTIQETIGECEPCPIGTYIDSSSGLFDCLSCSTCRDDQEEVSSCTSKKNTVCQCKKGTYCPPDQPCEICSPCKTSCPEDQDVKAPCSSTSDLLCPTPSSPPPDSTTGIIVTAVVVPLVLIAISVLVFCLCCRKTQNKDTGCRVIKKLPLSVCTGEKNRKENEDPLLQNNAELQFNESMDENEIFSRSFVIIDCNIPVKKFSTVMLKLGLDHDEIDRAKEENPHNVRNQHTAMLNALKQDSKFNINLLLKALQDLGLKTAALAIAKKLLDEELYTERPSNSA